MNWFNGLSLQWKVIIIIVILFLAWLAWRKYGYKLDQLTQARDITSLPSESLIITPGQSDSIKMIGKAIFDDIESTPVTGHEYNAYEDATQLTDIELNFLADYYKKYLGNGETLYKAIDSQYYITSGVPQKLMTRLAAIGKR